MHAHCKECTLLFAWEAKQWAVDYKGGKCEKCGYKECLEALEFHHRDPSQKDFSITKRRSIRDPEARARLALELGKCMLLCANCHRAAHGYSKKFTKRLRATRNK